MKQFIADLDYLSLPEKALITGIFLCFGTACYIAGLLTSSTF